MATSISAGQTWDPAGYERHARFVADLGAPVVELLAPRPGEDVLDLGCGDGALTERIAASGARVRGCDASPEFVRAARMRGLDVDEADGIHDWSFDPLWSLRNGTASGSRLTLAHPLRVAALGGGLLPY